MPTLPTILLLIGYRGTGKTTVARQLALRLGWDWVDADVEVELAAGKSIAKIFADDGENAFRELETEILARLLQQQRHVVSLGGGVVIRDKNRRLIQLARQTDGVSIWLTAAPETIHARLQTDPATAAQRPDLTAKGGLPEIIDVLAARNELYQQCANVVVDTDKKSVDEVVDEISAACATGDRPR